MKERYMEDDRIVEIPDYIKNMSEEERKRQIAILEEAGRKEAEHLPEMKPLLGIQIWEDSVNWKTWLTGIVWWDVCYSSGGDIMNNAVYVIDDHFEIPEYVKNMSSEERKKLIAILEEVGRREGENLPELNWPTI